MPLYWTFCIQRWISCYGFSTPFPSQGLICFSHPVSKAAGKSFTSDDPMAPAHMESYPRFAQDPGMLLPFVSARSPLRLSNWYPKLNCNITRWALGGWGPAPRWVHTNHNQMHMERHELWGQGDLVWIQPLLSTSYADQDNQSKCLGLSFSSVKWVIIILIHSTKFLKTVVYLTALSLSCSTWDLCRLWEGLSSCGVQN